jgi:hypothetical protein
LGPKKSRHAEYWRDDFLVQQLASFSALVAAVAT